MTTQNAIHVDFKHVMSCLMGSLRALIHICLLFVWCDQTKNNFETGLRYMIFLFVLVTAFRNSSQDGNHNTHLAIVTRCKIGNNVASKTFLASAALTFI